MTTDASWLTAVEPTPAGLIRAVESHLEGLERELAAAREALVTVESVLIAAHRQAALEPDALTTDQVARLLGLSRSTVTALIGRKEIASVKIGGSRRILRQDLQKYLGALPRDARV